jgi:hypothetical protein
MISIRDEAMKRFHNCVDHYREGIWHQKNFLRH